VAAVAAKALPKSTAGRAAAKRSVSLRRRDTACGWAELGCSWHGDSSAAAAHATSCEYRELTPSEIATTAPRAQHACPFAGVGCTAVFCSHRPLVAHADLAADKHLELLARAFGAAARERAELERHCTAQDRTIASVQNRAAAAERAAEAATRAADTQNANGIADGAAVRARSPPAMHSESGGGVDWQEVQRRLAQAEAKRKQVTSQLSNSAKAAMSRVKKADATHQATLRSLDNALQIRACAHCGVTYTEGGNTSHSCVYHPGVLMRDNRWSCCRRPCLLGAGAVPGLAPAGPALSDHA